MGRASGRFPKKQMKQIPRWLIAGGGQILAEWRPIIGRITAVILKLLYAIINVIRTGNKHSEEDEHDT
jgi:hypothetical protein